MTAPTPVAGARVEHTGRGIALLVAAVFSFAVMEAVAKWLARSYPPPMITWARYFLHALLMLVVLWPRMGARLLATHRPGMQIVRGGLLGLSSLVFFTSLTVLPLADAGAIGAITPILVTVLAIRFLKERPPPGTWWALAASFGGVLLIVRPGFGALSWWAMLPICSSLCYATYQLMTRRLAGVDDSETTQFFGAAVAGVVLSAVVPFFWRFPVSAFDMALFASTGVIGWFGHMLLVRAFDHASATTLAPFSYAHLVGSLTLGFAVFGNLPDGPALVGMGVIVATGVWMALRRRMPVEPVED